MIAEGRLGAACAYLDTSAFVKLVVSEPESQALAAELRRWPSLATSELLRTEAIRALRRSGHGRLVGAARRLMRGLLIVRLDTPLLDRAADLPGVELRSLDAVHLASALELGSELGALVTYDARIARAAEAAGIDVVAPAASRSVRRSPAERAGF